MWQIEIPKVGSTIQVWQIGLAEALEGIHSLPPKTEKSRQNKMLLSLILAEDLLFLALNIKLPCL